MSHVTHILLLLLLILLLLLLLLLLFYFICYSKVQQLQLLSQSIHAQTDYTPKHTCNSTITTQGMPTVILQVLFKKEETNHVCKRRKSD